MTSPINQPVQGKKWTDPVIVKALIRSFGALALIDSAKARALPEGDDSTSLALSSQNSLSSLERQVSLYERSGTHPLPSIYEPYYDPTNYTNPLDTSMGVAGPIPVLLQGNTTMQFYANSGSPGPQIYSSRATLGGLPTTPVGLISNSGSISTFKLPSASVNGAGDVGLVFLADSFGTTTQAYFFRINPSTGQPYNSIPVGLWVNTGGINNSTTHSIALSNNNWCVGNGDNGGIYLQLMTSTGAKSGAGTGISLTPQTTTRNMAMVQLGSGGNIMVVAENGGNLIGQLVSPTLNVVNTNWFGVTGGSRPAVDVLPDGRPVMAYGDASGNLVVEIRSASTGAVQFSDVVANGLVGLPTLAVAPAGQVAIFYTTQEGSFGSILANSGPGYALWGDEFFIDFGNSVSGKWIDNGNRLCVQFKDVMGKPCVDYFDYSNPTSIQGAIPSFNTTYTGDTIQWTIPNSFATNGAKGLKVVYDIQVADGSSLESVGASFNGTTFTLSPERSDVDTTLSFYLYVGTLDSKQNYVQRANPIPFSINVGNHPATVANPIQPLIVDVGYPVALNYTSLFSDPDGVATYNVQYLNNGTAVNLPWLTHNSAAKTIETLAVPSGAQGSYVVRVTATAPNYQPLSYDIPLTIPNRPVVFTNHQRFNTTAAAGAGISWQTPTVSDPDGDTYTYVLTQNPGYLTVNPQTGFVSGTVPLTSQAGTTDTFQVAVKDQFTSIQNADRINGTISIVAQGSAPTAVNPIPDFEIPAGVTTKINLAMDPSGSPYFIPQDNSLDYDITVTVRDERGIVVNVPSLVVTLDEVTRDLTINSIPSDKGLTVEILVDVSSASGMDSQDFTISLKPAEEFAPQAKTLNPQSVANGQPFIYELPADTFTSKTGEYIKPVLVGVESLNQYPGMIKDGTYSTKGYHYDENTRRVTVKFTSDNASGVKLIFQGENEFGKNTTSLNFTVDGTISAGDTAITVLSAIGSVAGIASAVWKYVLPERHKTAIVTRVSSATAPVSAYAHDQYKKWFKKESKDTEMTSNV